MAGVIVSVEADQITVQDAEQDLVTDGQYAVNFAAGERSVQKKAEFDILFCLTNLLAEHGRQEHEVVVVDPHEVVVLDVRGDCLGEQAIGFGVRIPSRFVECDLTGMVVEEGPEDGI